MIVNILNQVAILHDEDVICMIAWSVEVQQAAKDQNVGWILRQLRVHVLVCINVLICLGYSLSACTSMVTIFATITYRCHYVLSRMHAIHRVGFSGAGHVILCQHKKTYPEPENPTLWMACILLGT